MVRHLETEIAEETAAYRGGRPKESDEFVEVPPQTREGWDLAITKDFLGPLALFADVQLHHLSDEIFLAAEVIVERSFGHIRLIQNFLYTGGRVACRTNAAKTNLQQVLTCVLSFHPLYGSGPFEFGRPTSLRLRWLVRNYEPQSGQWYSAAMLCIIWSPSSAPLSPLVMTTAPSPVFS